MRTTRTARRSRHAAHKLSPPAAAVPAATPAPQRAARPKHPGFNSNQRVRRRCVTGWASESISVAAPCGGATCSEGRAAVRVAAPDPSSISTGASESRRRARSSASVGAAPVISGSVRVSWRCAMGVAMLGHYPRRLGVMPDVVRADSDRPAPARRVPCRSRALVTPSPWPGWACRAASCTPVAREPNRGTPKFVGDEAAPRPDGSNRANS